MREERSMMTQDVIKKHQPDFCTSPSSFGKYLQTSTIHFNSITHDVMGLYICIVTGPERSRTAEYSMDLQLQPVAFTSSNEHRDRIHQVMYPLPSLHLFFWYFIDFIDFFFFLLEFPVPREMTPIFSFFFRKKKKGRLIPITSRM